MLEQPPPGLVARATSKDDTAPPMTPVEETAGKRLEPDTRLDLMLGLHVPGVSVPPELQGWHRHDWNSFFHSEKEMNVAWNTRLRAEQPAFRAPNPDAVPIGSPREQAQRFLAGIDVIRSAGPFGTLAMIGRYVRTGGDMEELVRAARQAAPLDGAALLAPHRHEP